jgi:hypothetical protein
VLQACWWSKQQEIATALLTHRRVLVKAAHGVGKTHVAAGLINWHFDCFQPGITLSSAPTSQQVYDVLWSAVRAQRRGRSGLLPKAARMETSPTHFAHGFTANSPDAFQGRHAQHLLIIFDEATGIAGPFWDAAEGMQPQYWLCILNPTDTSSRAYEEELKGKFHVLTVSALEHPNIAAELAGMPAPFPAAVRLAWVQERIAEWCEPVSAADRRAGDIEFPPGSGQWVRPGPIAESRLLGRWPTQGATSVWTEAMWQAALVPQRLREEKTVLGCDVARFGDDFTSIVVRRGNCALHHETRNGWSTSETAGRLKQLCGQYAQKGEDPRHISVNIDDDGVGGGVFDQRGDFKGFFPLSGAAKAIKENDYPNKRSEFWFAVAERADTGMLDLSRLSVASLNLLRRQVMTPTYRLDSQGRRVVEPKSETKKRLGRSPDDADALNLAFALSRYVMRGAGPAYLPSVAAGRSAWTSGERRGT